MIGPSAKPDYATFPSLTCAQARAAADQLLSLRGDGEPAPEALARAVEGFLLREARLLDEERYDEWYALLADDLFYWAPLRENRFRKDARQAPAPDACALFDECKADIAMRIGRLNSKLAWTEDPPTRHVYMIAGIEVFLTDRADELEVHSTFLQYRNRNEHDEATLAGRRRDVLRRVDDGFRIARRLILLQQSVLLTKNLSVFF